ncbi:hypothetical protein [Empedobacter falsenii]|uniref:hypothetical protein n=1 Tax=Empedobacter falsenii TaxID=343874 RepID=UPI001C55FF7E|nr:hypothetical protein [Empedobacter falsenii]
MKYSNKRLFDFLLNANFNELPEKFLEFKKENKWQNYTPIQFKEKIFELTKSFRFENLKL